MSAGDTRAMQTWIALLRGINVGGRNKLPMKSLTAIVVACGGTDVRTYIQSGNVVFKAEGLDRGPFVDRLAEAINAEHGFRPAVQLLTAGAFEAAVQANPYPDAELEPTSLHLFFLTGIPTTLEPAEALLASSESIAMVDRCLYLRAPDGVARSKFVKQVDKALETRSTARNWRTVMALLKMAQHHA